MDIATRLVREPNVQDPEHYARRARRLAQVYAAMFLASLAGLALLSRWLEYYVTLAQRTNVETLTLALGLAMFLILAAMSVPGALGALTALRAWAEELRKGAAAAERLKARACERSGRRAEPVRVLLNAALERIGGAGALVFTLEDDAGDLGRIVVDGAVVTHDRPFRSGSNSLLAYFVEQVGVAVGRRGPRPWLEIVEWAVIDSSAAARGAALVAFARALETRLEARLWPRVELTEADERFIAERLKQALPSARLEALLPDWEYSGEHKLPVVPEPLGFLTLTRSESRVDPVSSMTMMLAVLLLSVAVLAVLVFLPPWVPAR